MNYAKIKPIDVANGPGIRVSIFVSGCTHHCESCFNEEIWDFEYGDKFTEDTIEKIKLCLNQEHIAGLTLLGGEPLERVNQQGLLPLVRAVKKAFPQKDIWCFTGYLFDEDVLGWMWDSWEETKELFSYLDVLVDGPFIEEKKDLNLRFKGSSNQRTILVQESLQKNKIILWDDKITERYSKMIQH